MKQSVSLVGSWKDAQSRRMQFLSDGTMFIDGLRYLYQIKGSKLFITASDMKLKAKYRVEGDTLYTTINGNTNMWRVDFADTVKAQAEAPKAASPKPNPAASAPAAVETEKIDPRQYEDMLKKEFGLTLEGGKWAFYGQVNDEKATLYDAGITYGVIKSVKEKLNDPQFQFCIITTEKITIVFNRPRPVCLITGLSAEGTSGVIANAIKDGAQCRIYNGVFIISF